MEILTRDCPPGATTGLIPEAIVDGLQNKVGNKNTKAIGAEIYQFFVCGSFLSPHISLPTLLIRLPP